MCPSVLIRGVVFQVIGQVVAELKDSDTVHVAILLVYLDSARNLPVSCMPLLVLPVSQLSIAFL